MSVILRSDGNSVSIRIDGEKELMRRLKALPIKVAKKVARGALRKGAKLVADKGTEYAPIGLGTLASSIQVRGLGMKRGIITVGAGPGKKWFQGVTFYGAFQEFGWRAGSRKRGDDRPEIPGKHYMERAYRTMAGAALQEVINQTWSGIEREASKA